MFGTVDSRQAILGCVAGALIWKGGWKPTSADLKGEVETWGGVPRGGEDLGDG